jgi:bifunctional non-homologous end joining protein LigD
VARCVLDGEIVSWQRGDYQGFQRLKVGESEVVYAVFDILHLDGYSTRDLDLLSRKQVLSDTFDLRRPLVPISYVAEAGEALFEEACRSGWEGIIAKRIDSRYESRRSPHWLKMKCVSRQEFVVGGFTDPKGSRQGMGALLLGYFDAGALVYAGLVGTGFSADMLAELERRLKSLELPATPFQRGAPDRKKGVHWVQPSLVVEVAFSEWTRDGRLRHPSFLGVRTDKLPHQVVRENPSSR